MSLTHLLSLSSRGFLSWAPLGGDLRLALAKAVSGVQSQALAQAGLQLLTLTGVTHISLLLGST